VTDSRIASDLLDRYLAGTCTADERSQVDQVLADHPDIHALIEGVVGHLGTLSVSPNVDLAWREALSRLHASHVGDVTSDVLQPTPPAVPEASASPATSARPLRGVWPVGKAAWYASAVLLLGGIGVVARMIGRHTGTSSTTVATYATTNGQRATITLLDGTVVALDVASRLDVPADFAAGDRTVRLSGSALFTVSHQERVPFTVQAGGISTRVLGTTFMVHHFPGDTTTQVAVRDGKVLADTTVVTASRMVTLGPRGTVRMQTIDGSPFLFASGVLVLDRMRLIDAIPELNRWYDVDLRLADPALGARLIEGRFPAGARSDLAEVLAWMFDANVTRNGHVLTLIPHTTR
jgi:ferric-dicitrate binding protein FerR (iron transport regulator)